MSLLRAVARAVVIGVLLGALVVALLWVFGADLTKRAQQEDVSAHVSAVWPDPRVQWTPVRVGGMMLARCDSAGYLRVVEVPDGSVLMVPGSGDPGHQQ